MTKLKIHLHLSTDAYCPPNEAHVILSYQDYAEMKELFIKHFDVVDYGRDEDGEPTFESWTTKRSNT